MGYERIARTVTVRMTCEQCRRSEEVTSDYNPDESVLPEPWVWIMGPVAAYQNSALPEALVCSEECAGLLAADIARNLYVSQVKVPA